MPKLLLIALAGALGSLCRYGLGGVVQRLGGADFPWATLAVNLLGCFLFGAVWTAATERGLLGAETRLIILTGFMGAFTTFSTFGFETVQLARDGQWLLAGTNVLVQVVLGAIGVLLGFGAGRLI